MEKFKKIGLIGLLSFILITSSLTFSFASQLLATRTINGFGSARDDKLFGATASDINFYMAYGLTKWYGAAPVPVAAHLLITDTYDNGEYVEIVFDSSYAGFSGVVEHLMNEIGEPLYFQYSLQVSGPNKPWLFWGGGGGSPQENWCLDFLYIPTVDFKDYASSIDSIKLFMNASFTLNPDYWENGYQYHQGLLEVNSWGRWEIWGTPVGTTPVPEPTTMFLLGSGLIGLAGYGRKKFFKK